MYMLKMVVFDVYVSFTKRGFDPGNLRNLEPHPHSISRVCVFFTGGAMVRKKKSKC